MKVQSTLKTAKLALASGALALAVSGVADAKNFDLQMQTNMGPKRA